MVVTASSMWAVVFVGNAGGWFETDPSMNVLFMTVMGAGIAMSRVSSEVHQPAKKPVVIKQETPAEVEAVLFPDCLHRGQWHPVWTTEEKPRLVAVLCGDCREDMGLEAWRSRKGLNPDGTPKRHQEGKNDWNRQQYLQKWGNKREFEKSKAALNERKRSKQ